MKASKKNLLSGSFLLILILLLFFFINQNLELRKEKDAFSFALENVQSDYSAVKNERVKEKALYSQLSAENKELLKEVLILKKRKQKVEYITETKYITETVEKIITKMPDSYLYQTSYGMPVCLYEKLSSDQHSFKTLPAEYSVSIISSKEETLVKVKAKSLFDGNYYKIPLEDITTKTIKVAPPQEDFFQTDLSIGFAITSTIETPTSLGVSFMEYKDFNFLKINLLIDNTPSLGVSPVSWNLGSKLTLIQDLSLEAGLEVQPSPNAYFGLSTKF